MKSIFLALLLCVSAFADDFYVATTGNDTTGTGAVGAPWLTVQKAVNTIGYGDTILLAAGTYAGFIINSVSGDDCARCTIDGQNVATINTQIDIRKPYWTIKNLQVKGYTDPASKLVLKRLAHYTYLDNLHFDNQDIDAGTTFHHCIDWVMVGSDPGPFNDVYPSHCRITNCLIEHVRGAVCINMNGNYNLVENNVMRDCVQADNIRPFGQGHVIRGNEVYNNIVSNDVAVGFHGDFVQCYGGFWGSRDILIENNYVHDTQMQICQTVEGTPCTTAEPHACDLIGTGATSNHTWRNNLFVRNELGCSYSMPNGKWYNNTFYMCGFGEFGSNYGHIINLGGTSGGRGSSNGTEIFNNVFLDCGDSTKDSVGWYADGTLSGTEVVYTADYNFVSKRGFQPVRSAATRSQFRWNEVHGINGGNPGFISLASMAENFHPSEGSVLVGAALPFNTLFTLDKDGTVRGGSWEIGTFEFALDTGGTVPTAPSGLSVTAISHNRIDLSWTDNSSDEDGFHVYRSLTSGTGFTILAVPTPGVTTYSDLGLAPGTQYYYKVAAYNESGESAMIGELSATTATAPGAGRRGGAKSLLSQ